MALGQPQLGKQCPRAGRHPVVQKAGVSAASPTPGGDNAAACTHAAVMCKRAHAHVVAESLRLPVMCVQRRVPVKRLGRPPLHVSTSPLLHAQLTRRGGAAWHPRQPARARRWQAAGETCGQRGHCGQHGDGPAALSPVCSLSVPPGPRLECGRKNAFPRSPDVGNTTHCETALVQPGSFRPLIHLRRRAAGRRRPTRNNFGQNAYQYPRRSERASERAAPLSPLHTLKGKSIFEDSARHGLRTRPPGGDPRAADGNDEEDADGDGRRIP